MLHAAVAPGVVRFATMFIYLVVVPEVLTVLLLTLILRQSASISTWLVLPPWMFAWARVGPGVAPLKGGIFPETTIPPLTGGV